MSKSTATCTAETGELLPVSSTSSCHATTKIDARQGTCGPHQASCFLTKLTSLCVQEGQILAGGSAALCTGGAVGPGAWRCGGTIRGQAPPNLGAPDSGGSYPDTWVLHSVFACASQASRQELHDTPVLVKCQVRSRMTRCQTAMVPSRTHGRPSRCAATVCDLQGGPSAMTAQPRARCAHRPGC